MSGQTYEEWLDEILDQPKPEHGIKDVKRYGIKEQSYVAVCYCGWEDKPRLSYNLSYLWIGRHIEKFNDAD